MQHNGSALTRVKGASLENPHRAVFQYTASAEQLLASVDRARHCQQELELHCRRSRLQDPRGRQPLPALPDLSLGGVGVAVQGFRKSLTQEQLTEHHGGQRRS